LLDDGDGYSNDETDLHGELLDDMDSNYLENDSDQGSLTSSSKQKAMKSYIIMNRETLINSQKQDIKSISELYDIPKDVAALLLYRSSWDAQAIQDNVIDLEEYLSTKAKSFGILLPQDFKDKNISESKTYECTICLEEYGAKLMNIFNCGHMFCNDCCFQHLNFHIEQNSPIILCPSRGCGLVIPKSSIESVLGYNKSLGNALLNKYEANLLDSYVNDSKKITWCPGVDCGNAVKVTTFKEPHIECTCGSKFCFSCGNFVHIPVTCQMMIDWDRKIASDEASVQHVALSCKNCPKCNVTMMKDG